MNKKRLVTVSGSIGLILILAVLSFMVACTPTPTPTPVPPGPEKVELGFSTTLAPGSCPELAADKFKERVEEKTDGRITIVRYPCGELYSPKDEIEAMSMGDIEMDIAHAAFVGALSPALEFMSSFGALGCWDDYDHYFRFIEQPEVLEIAASEFESKLNGKLLAFLTYGPNLGGAIRPIHTMEDLKGLKLRTTGSAQAAVYKALGAVPTQLSSKEVYMALQRGTIDGALSGPGRFYFSKWYEVTPYLVQDYLFPYLSFFLVINLDVWNKLSEEDQQILSDVAREIEEWTRIYAVKEAAEIYEKFQRGLVKELYFMPESEVARMREIARPVMHDLIIDRAGAEMGEKLWSLVEAARK